jgi:hypothetical protein
MSLRYWWGTLTIRLSCLKATAKPLVMVLECLVLIENWKASPFDFKCGEGGFNYITIDELVAHVKFLS